MDRASASEAGNVGSTPAGRKLKKPRFCEAFYLRQKQANGQKNTHKAHRSPKLI